MKHLKRFDIINENTSYNLPAATGNPEKDEDTFLFSTKDEKKSIIMNLILDKVSSSSKIFGDVENVSVLNFGCEYMPGDDVVTYTYEFGIPSEEIKKETEGGEDLHEWQVIAQVPADIISKINSGELPLQQGEKEIKSKITFSYRDGLDAKLGGWQIKTIQAYKDRNTWLSKEKESDSKNPKWIQKFSTWLTTNFG